MTFDSKVEEKLYENLEAIGLHPKIHYPISDMHVDFAFPEHKIAVEVDGKQHEGETQRYSDNERLAILQQLGWVVRRVTAEEVYRDPKKTAYKIKYFVKGIRERGQDSQPTLESYEQSTKTNRIPVTGTSKVSISPQHESSPNLLSYIGGVKTIFFLGLLILILVELLRHYGPK